MNIPIKHKSAIRTLFFLDIHPMRARIGHGAFTERVRRFLRPLIVRFRMPAIHYRKCVVKAHS